ncbi:MAG: hypothetical protein AVO38_08760 [delta proteobacterium ML8_D]|jgi:tetratricopeptide (TPR) repeat protein|nr:MAG: hypothetical protein AVO38_08760 [delta proteobacterium ML8_D]
MVKVILFNLKILQDKFPVVIALIILLTFISSTKSSGTKGEDTFYTVQIAAYKNLDNARAMMNAPELKELELFYRSVNSKKETWHCVLMGRYKSRQEAVDFGQSLKKDGVIKDFLIRRLDQPMIDSENNHESISTMDDSLNVKKGMLSEEPISKLGTDSKIKDQKIKETSLYDAAMKDFESGSYKNALSKLELIIQHKDLRYANKEFILRRIGDIYYLLGMKGEGNKKYLLKAINNYRNLIRDYPDSKKEDSLLTTYRLAKSYEYLHLYQESLIEFQHLYSRYPESEHIAEATFKIAKMYYRMGRHDRAIEQFKEYIKKFPDQGHVKDAYFCIGDCYSQLRQFNDANDWYGKALKKWPSLEKVSKSNILNLGSFYLDTERYDQALKTFSAFLNMFPEEKYSKEVINKLARSFIGADQVSLGLKILGFIIRNYPKSKEAYESAVIMADIETKNSKVRKPIVVDIRTLNSTIKVPAYNSICDDIILTANNIKLEDEIPFLKGYALLKGGSYKQSFDIYHSLLGQCVYENYKEASEKCLILSANYLINEYHSKNDHIAICDIYFKTHKYGLYKYGDFDTLIKIGNNLRNIGLLTCAIEHFRKMIDPFKKHEKIKDIFLDMAKLDYDRANYDEAERGLNTLLKNQFHTDKKILINAKKLLGDIYYRKGLFENAACLYSEVLSFADGFECMADVYRNYANSLRERGLYSSAFINYKRAVKLYKNKESRIYSSQIVVDSYEGLGDYFYNEGRYQKAISMYEQAVNHDQESAQRPWTIFNIGRGYLHLGNSAMAEKSFSSLKGEGADEFWSKLIDYCIYDNAWTERHGKCLVNLATKTAINN